MISLIHGRSGRAGITAARHGTGSPVMRSRLRFTGRFWRTSAWALLMLAASLAALAGLWSDTVLTEPPVDDDSEIPPGFYLGILALGLAGGAGYLLFSIGQAVHFAMGAAVVDTWIVSCEERSLFEDGSTWTRNRIVLEYLDRLGGAHRAAIVHLQPARWAALKPGMTVVAALGRNGRIRLPGDLMVLPSSIDPDKDPVGPHIPEG